MSNYKTKFMDPFIEYASLPHTSVTSIRHFIKASIGQKASLCEKLRLSADNRRIDAFEKRRVEVRLGWQSSTYLRYHT